MKTNKDKSTILGVKNIRIDEIDADINALKCTVNKALIIKNNNTPFHSSINQYLQEENAKYPENLIRIDENKWPTFSVGTKPLDVWRSRYFLVQIFDFEPIRLTINRTSLQNNGQWDDKILWDELQSLKNQCGFGDYAAVEIFPPDKDLINDCNMRHLWIMGSPPHFMWQRN